MSKPYPGSDFEVMMNLQAAHVDAAKASLHNGHLLTARLHIIKTKFKPELHDHHVRLKRVIEEHRVLKEMSRESIDQIWNAKLNRPPRLH